tara:strand:- start:755 stop:1000 length:246 start_codon:yes stop_codon:yes gene_type:complete
MWKWCFAGVIAGWSGTAAAQVDVGVTYLRLDDRKPPTLSDIEPDPANLGIAGAPYPSARGTASFASRSRWSMPAPLLPWPP